MKLNILTVVVLLAGSLLSQAAEYGYFRDILPLDPDDFVPQSITLNAGDRIQFVSGYSYLNVQSIIVTLPDSTIHVAENLLLNNVSGNRSVGEIIGPCILSTNGSTQYVGYKITRAGTENSSSYITVPSNPSGNFELKLQTSTDLETWSSTTPGVFPYVDNAKFFRLVMETP